MTKKSARSAAAGMLAAALCFVLYAANHPERSFPWPNGVTYALYAAYCAAAAVLLLAPFPDKR